MTHIAQEKQKLINRIRRLKGQLDALERALDEEASCTEVMRLITAGRGAINGIMAEVIEGHIRTHMVDETRKPTRSETRAADELLDVLRTYIK